MDQLIDFGLVIKKRENNKIYYKNAPIFEDKISKVRSIGPGTADGRDLFEITDLSDVIPNMPPMELTQMAISPSEEEFTLEQSTIEERESITHEAGAIYDNYIPTNFEVSLENAFSSDLPWKKELIEIVKARASNNKNKIIKLLKKSIQKAIKNNLISYLPELYKNLAEEYSNDKLAVKNIYLEAIDFFNKLDDKRYSIDFYIKLGDFQYKTKNYEDALKQYKIGLSLVNENDLIDFIHILFNKIAMVYRELNQFENALEYYLKDLPISEKQFKQDLGKLLNKIGGVLIKLGRNSEALNYFDRAISIFKDNNDINNQIISLMNKNVALFNLKQWDSLIDLYLNVLELLKDPEKKERIWRELGTIIQHTSKKELIDKYKSKIKELKIIESEEELARRARTITKMAVSSEISTSKITKALWSFNTAVSAFVEGNYEKAEKLYLESEKLYQELEDLKGIGLCNHHLGLIYLQNDQIDQAISRLQFATNAFENIKKEISIEQFRTTLQSDVIPVLEDLTYAFILKNNKIDALDSLERGKSRELIRKMDGFDTIDKCPKMTDLIRKENILLGYFQEREDEITQLKSDYINNYINFESYKQRIKKINKEIKDASIKLREIRTKIYENCADPGKVQPSLNYSIVNKSRDIIGKMDILILEFFYYKRMSKIFTIVLNSNHDLEYYSKPVNNKELLSKIEQLKMGIDTLNEDIVSKLGRDLFELVIPTEFSMKYLNTPIEKPLIIIPHHELFAIPWEILQNPHSSGKWDGFLGLECLLTRNFSLDLTRIMLQKHLEKKGNEILLLGNPTNDLDGAMEEVLIINEVIGQHGIKTNLLLGKSITLNSLKNNLRSNKFGVVHYAGHADFMESDPSLSMLILNDGPITARELGLMHSNNSLFYLSACESGQASSISGGEIFGIIRGLTLSGAQTIISTNWKVADDSARDLAIQFYKSLESGLNAAYSLREARRFVKIKYKEILHWAAPTIYGNPIFTL
ncbi:MAG: CHAT domain-containing protein [Candidatus Helarchaeota archaeon]